VSYYPDISRHAGIKDFDLLEELALNLRWTWNHRTDEIWKKLDEKLWDATHNPWIVLRTVSGLKVADLLANEDFKAEVLAYVHLNRRESSSPGWYQQNHLYANLGAVAYFSMEYMLTEALPIYSGGLGNVAGDQLKAASDLGVPVIAVGLLYQQGYFRQMIDATGRQQALYPYNDPGQLPLVPLRTKDGQWLRIELQLPGSVLWLRTWHARVGRAHLFLLDTNDMSNFPAHRGITTELYGGDVELRLKQEIVLGIGGWRLLQAMGIQPDVCHLNEGHASFAILERIRSYMVQEDVGFDVALTATRAGNLFTTHTAVPAGFDSFQPDMLQHYLGSYVSQELDITCERFLSLGQEHAGEVKEEPFNMAYLALRGCGFVNGVSRVHSEVSRCLFSPLFPRWPQNEVPIGYVTNGVHMPSWDSAAADALWTASCGKKRWLDTTEQLGMLIKDIPPERIWEMRQQARSHLIAYACRRYEQQLTLNGTSEALIAKARQALNPKVLTLGFARRFATYKRPNLLLSDPERLVRLLNHPTMPVQLIIAGKAHPADVPGISLIKEWCTFIEKQESSGVILLSDYDMMLTEQLVQGTDVWINTPKHPWEACGTSGMKILVNGGLNLSELDGWWSEAYSPAVGWALGGNGQLSDAEEAAQLYDILEQQVVPEFYARNAQDLPLAWVSRIRESMARLTGDYSSNRSVREYVEKYYLPAAEAYHTRSRGGSAVAKNILAKQQELSTKWHGLAFDSVKVTETIGHYQFEVALKVNGIDPKDLKVELYAEELQSSIQMERSDAPSSGELAVYVAVAPSLRTAGDYTPRVIPNIETLSTPLECPQILWQK
jgi:starch phosphorylase